MEAAGLVLDALGRVRDMVRNALEDLSPEEMLASPQPHIAWLVWHLSRVQDANFSGLLDKPQLWVANGWHDRFNMPPDPKDYGSGHRQTRAQVSTLLLLKTARTSFCITNVSSLVQRDDVTAPIDSRPYFSWMRLNSEAT